MRIALSVTFCMLMAASLMAEGKVASVIGTKEMDALAAKAKEWGVPQPDPESRLIKYWVFQRGATDMYALGFVSKRDPGNVLIGFDHQAIKHTYKVKEIPDIHQLSLRDVSPSSPFSHVNEVNTGLITGIQLYRMGHADVAIELVGKSLGEDVGHPLSAFRSPANESPQLMLARSCLADSINQISSESPNFKAIDQRVRLLYNEHPELKGRATDWLLKGLKSSMEHEAPPAGSIEAIIDAYLMSGGTSGAMSFSNQDMRPAEAALILKGFEAVPALLKLRDSDRFTNHVMQGFNNFVSHPMNAGQVVNDYLRRLANDEFGSNWLVRQQGGAADEDAVLEWWKKASDMGEKDYVAEYAVVPDEERGALLSRELLFIAQNRYPELLPNLYHEAIKEKVHSWPVLAAVKVSDLNEEKKLELCRAGIATNREEHRNYALSLLQQLRPNEADEVLIRLLKSSPKTTEGEYWTDQNARLSSYVSKSHNAKVWKAMHAYLDRADLGMQMELIDNLKPPKDSPLLVQMSFFKVYDSFSQDKRVRDTSKSDKYSGPGAGHPHDVLSMRDFIHLHWSRWLKLEMERPKDGAKQKEWTAFRDEVSKAVREYRSKTEPGEE